MYPNWRQDKLRFAVVGDSQGRNQALAAIVEAINQADVNFVIHLGDMVPAGQEGQYRDFLDTMAALNCPFYAVPGNHDVCGAGRDLFQQLFGPLNKTFSWAEYNFILLDSSDHTVDRQRLRWLREQLRGRDQPLVFLHVPPLDPRGEGHGFLVAEAAWDFIETVASAQPKPLIFTGHVHVYAQQEVEGVRIITSGGGGAPLYAPAEQGGVHHFLLVTAQGDNVEISCQPVPTPQDQSGLLLLTGRESREFTPADLEALGTVTGESCFQNQFGNFSPQATYRGVPLRTLVEQVGGMRPEDVLVVQSVDGYVQEFSFGHVHPEKMGWEDLQGEAILALAADEEKVPSWREGYRLVFLPPDGTYSNKDCWQTSDPGPGWHQYPSAGARWVRNVVQLKVNSHPSRTWQANRI